MRQVLKWLGIGLSILFGVLVVALASTALLGSSKLDRRYAIEPEAVAVPMDALSIERGQYLAAVSCAGCHGDDMGGAPFFQDAAMGSIPAPNLTTGTGGAAATYRDADFVRAIRHGVGPDGRALAIMPAQAFWHYSDEDLGAIIAWLRSAPPVDNDPGERSINLLPRLLIGIGAMKILAAESIDHAAARPTPTTPQAGAAYGEYLVNTNDCRQCHGTLLAGGQSSEPGAPPGPGLLGKGGAADWTSTEFIAAMRSGVTPDGRTLDARFMPWEDYGRMTDDDLAALHLYLQSLPATEEGSQ